MKKKWRRDGVGVYRDGGADNKKITFIFQNEPFLLLTGYLEFHFRSQGKSAKSQGIPSWKKSGNPDTFIERNDLDFLSYTRFSGKPRKSGEVEEV